MKTKRIKMKTKRILSLLLRGALILALMSLFACFETTTEDEKGDDDTNIGTDGGSAMQLTQSNICEETTELINSISLGDFGTMTSTGTTGSQSVVSLKRVIFAATTTTCPTTTMEPPLTFDFTKLPSTMTVTVDYGNGCTPTGSNVTMSGKLVVVFTKLSVVNSSTEGSLDIVCDYTMTATNLSSEENTLNGKVSGSVDITTNLATGAMTGTMSMDFNNFTEGNKTVNGYVSLKFNIDDDELGTTKVTLKDFSGGQSKYSGTIDIAQNTETSSIIAMDITSTNGNIDMMISSTKSTDGKTTTINTTGTSTYKGLTFSMTDVVLEAEACKTEPISGTMDWTDVNGNTAEVVFDGVCDGKFTVTMNGGSSSSCSN